MKRIYAFFGGTLVRVGSFRFCVRGIAEARGGVANQNELKRAGANLRTGLSGACVQYPSGHSVRTYKPQGAGSCLVCRDDRFEDDIRCERRTFAGLCICDDVMLVDENRNVFSASHP